MHKWTLKMYTQKKERMSLKERHVDGRANIWNLFYMKTDVKLALGVRVIVGLYSSQYAVSVRLDEWK